MGIVGSDLVKSVSIVAAITAFPDWLCLKGIKEGIH